MKTIVWKRNNRETSDKINWLSDRFVLVICLLIAKRKKSYREKWEGIRELSQYINLLRSNTIKSELLEKTPYKEILEQINEPSVSKEVQNQIFGEYKTYSADYKVTITNWNCAAMTMLICTPILLFLGLLFLITGMSLPVGIILSSFSVLLFISSLRFIFVKRKPSRDINFFLNAILCDRKAFNSLNELYNEITNIQKTDVSIINVNQTDIKIENIHNEYNLVNNNYTLLENSSLKTKKNIKNKEENPYQNTKKEDLIKIFKEKYSAIFEEYQDFFTILQTKPFNRQFLLSEDYKVNKKEQKILMSFIGGKAESTNDIDLIYSLFEPEYKNRQHLIKALATPSRHKSEKFISFLNKEQKKINFHLK